MTQKFPERIAVFAGSFNPYTIGHDDIAQRALLMFDRLAICVGVNINKGGSHNAIVLADSIRQLYQDEPRITVDTWSGLTGDYARKIGAQFLVRGVRSVKDFEYERDMADANKKLFGLETVLLTAKPDLAYVSSSMVRELSAYGMDISQFLPTKY